MPTINLIRKRVGARFGTWVMALVLLTGIYLVLVVLAPASIELSFVQEARSRTISDTLSTTEATKGKDRLYIKKIGLQVAIVQGTNEDSLLGGAWHRKPENGNPKDGGNFVLSAHRFVLGLTPSGTSIKSPFYNIHKLTRGDKITVDYSGVRYKYEVNRTYSVKPSQVEIEAPTETAKLTLYSCTLRGSIDGRDVIEALPVEA